MIKKKLFEQQNLQEICSVLGKIPMPPKWMQKRIKNSKMLAQPMQIGKDEANFNGQLHFDWVKHAYKKPTRVKKEPNPEPKSPSTTPAMIFDVELGCMVPM